MFKYNLKFAKNIIDPQPGLLTTEYLVFWKIFDKHLNKFSKQIIKFLK